MSSSDAPLDPTPPPPMPLKRIHFLVHGKVQGVWYRRWTWDRALAHNVTGFVRNLRNGKVEGEAQGTEEALQNLVKDLDKGSPGSSVIRVDTTPMETLVEDEKGFEIRKSSG